MTELIKKISLGQFLTIIANVSVLIGIVLVIQELRQNQVHMQAEVEMNLGNSYRELMASSLASPELINLRMRLYGDPDSLDWSESLMIQGKDAEWLSVLYSTFQVWKLGIIGDEAWQQHLNYNTSLFVTQWYQDFWEATAAHAYPAEFIDEVKSNFPQNVPYRLDMPMENPN